MLQHSCSGQIVCCCCHQDHQAVICTLFSLGVLANFLRRPYRAFADFYDAGDIFVQIVLFYSLGPLRSSLHRYLRAAHCRRSHIQALSDAAIKKVSLLPALALYL